jgi:thymidylate kinase
VTAFHPRLDAAFIALDEAGVRWCLLRDPADPAAPRGDVDLLVHSRDAAGLAAALTAQGFVAVPGWTRLPAMLWVGYEESDGHFLVLDITDELTFGPEGALTTGLGQQCLARRQQRGPQYLLDPDDGFWALLLHCLLDKQQVPEHYRERLRKLAVAARSDGPLGSLVADAERLRESALAGNWDRLVAAGAVLREQWPKRHPVHPVLLRARRLLRAPLLLRRRRGLSVALLGLNGAGKSTLTTGLAERFPFPVAEVYMGLWRSGELPGLEIPLLAPLLRPAVAWRRYLTGLHGRLLGKLVVFDRYVHDARLSPAPPFVRAKRGYMWLLARSVPRPDLVLLLDLPARVASDRKSERTAEQNEVERAGYLALAGAMPEIEVLDASQEPEVLLRQALGLIWSRYRHRWGSG